MPCVFFLPKTTDTTITEITINNAVRPTVQTTMVVPIEDFRKYGGKRSGKQRHNCAHVVIGVAASCQHANTCVPGQPAAEQLLLGMHTAQHPFCCCLGWYSQRRCVTHSSHIVMVCVR
jgi:hypothetical protein